MYTIVGLGNPGEEYEKNRHNAGRIVLLELLESFKFPELEASKNAKALYSWGKVGKVKVEALLPETYMNKSGFSVKYAVQKHNLKPENIIVMYDDIDLPFGAVRVSFGRNSGGHNGIESVQKALKAKNFIRIRIGVAKVSRGKAKKPAGEDAVVKYLLGNFTKKELDVVKSKIADRVHEGLKVIFETGNPEMGMNAVNGLPLIQ